jgi:hypothetical protein
MSHTKLLIPLSLGSPSLTAASNKTDSYYSPTFYAVKMKGRRHKMLVFKKLRISCQTILNTKAKQPVCLPTENYAGDHQKTENNTKCPSPSMAKAFQNKSVAFQA